MHYARLVRHGDTSTVTTMERGMPCSVNGCEQLVKARGLCGMHYSRNRAHGDPNTVLVAPKGAGWIADKGYHRIKIKGRTFRVHRLVVESIIGRKLLPDEDVHHKNHNPRDNRPENLEVIKHGAHTTFHKRGKPTRK